MEKVEEVYKALQKSTFRSRFHLNQNLKKYALEKGRDTMERHAYDFLLKRIAPSVIKNDGHQTPMKAHPVFIAQHAMACCCRGCIEKWHHIPKGRTLSEDEITYLVSLIMYYLDQEMKTEKKWFYGSHGKWEM